MFRLFGIHNERAVELIWDDGRLDGDPHAVLAIQAEAGAREGRDVGPPTGPFTTTRHLSDALSALLIIDEAFDEIGVLEGDVPEAPGAEIEDESDEPVVF